MFSRRRRDGRDEAERRGEAPRGGGRGGGGGEGRRRGVAGAGAGGGRGGGRGGRGRVVVAAPEARQGPDLPSAPTCMRASRVLASGFDLFIVVVVVVADASVVVGCGRGVGYREAVGGGGRS